MKDNVYFINILYFSRVQSIQVIINIYKKKEEINEYNCFQFIIKNQS